MKHDEWTKPIYNIFAMNRSAVLFSVVLTEPEKEQGSYIITLMKRIFWEEEKSFGDEDEGAVDDDDEDKNEWIDS